tara:strand:- start:42 stop:572 length:531 start_codon:yes stop_codon:yes gene_type:complete
MDKFEFKYLGEITFEQFKFFLNSLDEEKKTWSLDLQTLKDDREFYNCHAPTALVCLFDKKIIGCISFHKTNNVDQKIFTDEFKYFNTVNFSCVVKKEFQGMGLGTKLLLAQETVCLRLGYDSVVSIQFKTNYAAHRYVEKAGWTILGGRLGENRLGKNQILVVKKFKKEYNEDINE